MSRNASTQLLLVLLIPSALCGSDRRSCRSILGFLVGGTLIGGAAIAGLAVYRQTADHAGRPAAVSQELEPINFEGYKSQERHDSMQSLLQGLSPIDKTLDKVLTKNARIVLIGEQHYTIHEEDYAYLIEQIVKRRPAVKFLFWEASHDYQVSLDEYMEGKLSYRALLFDKFKTDPPPHSVLQIAKKLDLKVICVDAAEREKNAAADLTSRFSNDPDRRYKMRKFWNHRNSVMGENISRRLGKDDEGIAIVGWGHITYNFQLEDGSEPASLRLVLEKAGISNISLRMLSPESNEFDPPDLKWRVSSLGHYAGAQVSPAGMMAPPYGLDASEPQDQRILPREVPWSDFDAAIYFPRGWFFGTDFSKEAFPPRRTR